jgi:urea transport system ATP-binding protein
MFKRRVGGVYFAIITQAISAILTILIIGQQGYTGGINGITDLRTLLGWDIRTDSARYILYFINAVLLMLVVSAGYFIVNSKLGRLMVAIRDKEDRVRFSGYDVANIKTVVFCISALFSAIGGAMFTLQVGFMSPGFIGTVASIEMVVFCAVGGRGSLLGAVYGALIVNAAKSSISESFPGCHGPALYCRRADFPERTGRALSAIYSPDRDVAAAQKEYDQTQSKHRSAEMKNPIKEIILAVEGLTVSFNGFKAVDDFSMYIDEGQIYVIIGPNGAGKTTVLDLICGKTKLTSGSIKFRNKELSKLRENKIVHEGVGRKFQNPSIYENLTVFENLELSYPKARTALGAMFFRRTPEIIAAVEQVAGEIFLADYLHTQADLLSHGQKQWLEIGMLLIQDPKLMMLDEPVAGMSVAERQKTAQLLRKIAGGRSVLVIEHDMQFVEDIADHVTVMHQGKVLSEGSINKVKNDPRVIDVYLGH